MMKDQRASERESLLSSDPHSETLERVRPPRSLVMTLAVAALLVLALTNRVAVYSRNSEAEILKNSPLSSDLMVEAAETLSFEVTNAYGEAKYGVEHPFIGDQYVAEPYKTMTFTAVGSAVNQASSIRWEIDGANGLNGMLEARGDHVEATFKIVGQHTVKVTALDEHGQVVVEHDGTIFTTYVKRELRNLNDEDREMYLDTAAMIWATPTSEGRKKYGDSYTGMDTFVQVHADSATGDIKCDQWHEGTGFLTHHLALSLSFEASLRAVNPKVTMPYWDFTIDGEAIKIRGGGPSMLPSVNDFFTSKWFGSTDENSHVIDGRWAHAGAIMYGGGLTHNSYGVIRAPWNNNPDLELTRHLFDVCGQEPVNKPVPTCQVHAAVINQTTLGGVQSNIAGWGHGTLHVNTGGVFGECTSAMVNLYDKYRTELSEVVTMESLGNKVKDMFGVETGWQTDDKFPLQDFVIDAFHLEYFHIYRTLWRSQTCAVDGEPLALSCPEHCDLSTPSSECKCTCHGVETDDFDWENIEPCLYMQDKTKWITQSALPKEFRKDLVTTFCSAGVQEGEQLESASPMDIFFWNIHPALERLTFAKRLTRVPGNKIAMGNYGVIVPFEDETWKSFSSYSTDDYTCKGHGPDDEALSGLTILPRVAELADTDGDGMVSNVELYAALDPTQFMADYVYDHYRWDHCKQEAELTDKDLQALHTESYAAASLRPFRAKNSILRGAAKR